MNRIFFLILVSIFGLNLLALAQGDLLVTPTRIVFEGNLQKEEINLVNIGKDTATYTISFVQYNMMEDGRFIAIDKPDSGQMFADPYLRIFPRKVTLAPREPQVIVMQCRRKSDMLAGEYRSHLYFRAEKDLNPIGMKTVPKDSTRLNVSLIPVYGLSIPIIIRSGEVSVSTELSDLQLAKSVEGGYNLTLSINRSGNISVYGDLIVQYVPNQGNPVEIGSVKGVGVYTNLNKRNITMKLNTIPGIELNSGKLKVQYTSNGSNARVVYSEKEIDINESKE